MVKMTVKQAALHLGVSGQTILNLIKRGVLSSVKEKKLIYVNSDDIERYAAKYRMLSVSLEQLTQTQGDIENECYEADKLLTELRRELIPNTGRNFPLILREVIRTLSSIKIEPLLEEREIDILTRYLKGDSLEKMGQQHNISSERCRQIILRALRLFVAQLINIAERTRENTRLRSDNEQLKGKIENLQLENATLKDDLRSVSANLEETEEYIRELNENPVYEKPAILERRIVDIPEFSRRIINALSYYEVYDLEDLLTKHNEKDLRRMRNMGTKCIWIIQTFLKNNNLSFMEPGEYTTKYYARINKNRK